jgi:hypothetical protein
MTWGSFCSNESQPKGLSAFDEHLMSLANRLQKASEKRVPKEGNTRVCDTQSSKHYFLFEIDTQVYLMIC